jgi:hypothetical protein
MADRADHDTPTTPADEWELMRQAPYPDPAAQDRGEVLAWSGVGIGLIGVGVVAASAICPPCMMGVAPLAAATAPGLIVAGAIKRWRSRKKNETG